MPRLNSKVKIQVVDKVFVGPEYETDLWMPNELAHVIAKELGKKDKKQPIRFMAKLKIYAKQGFADFEGGEGSPIKHEEDGVYRVAHGHTLFRLIGFYENRKTEFIALDAFWKHGQELRHNELERIRRVAQIKKARTWSKREQ